MTAAHDQKLQTSVFDTRRIAPDQRFKLWRESIGVIFDTELDRGHDPMRFQARVEGTMFGQVVLGSVASGTQLFTRPLQKILADGNDSYLVQVFLGGGCEVQDGRHTRRVRPGDIYIIDASAPLHAVDTEFTHVTAVIPRDVLSPRLHNPDGHHRRILRGDTPLAQVLYRYMLTLDAQREGMTQADVQAALSALMSLTEGLLNSAGRPRPGGAFEGDPAALDFAALSSARRYIQGALADPQLSPEHVAGALGLSRAQLYRLFKPLGGVAHYIRNRRLRRSLQDLLDPACPPPRISEVGYRWGFRSESDFSRAFKRRYGMSPRDARAAGGLPGLGPAAAVTGGQDRSRDYERWLRALYR